MTVPEATKLAENLIGRSEVLLLGTVDADGHPNIKALSKWRRTGSRTSGV